MGGTHQGFESALEVFVQVESEPGIYLQSVEDRRQVAVDGPRLPSLRQNIGVRVTFWRRIARMHRLPIFYSDPNILNGWAGHILPFQKFLKLGMQLISLFYMIFAGLTWQTVVAIKRHTRR